MLLHKDGSYKTYYTFFSHLASEFKIKINSLELGIPEELVFGSDDEKAMTNAIRDAFPSATRLLCSKHFKDNLKHYLQNKIGVEVKKRNEIMDNIFGKDGVVNANNTVDFEDKSNTFKDQIDQYPKLAKYFTENLKPRIKTFVNEPRRKNKDKSEKLWINNNAESINHVSKVAIKWKPQSTPELIKKLYDCDQIWRCKSEDEKSTIFENFLLDKKRKRKIIMISSTDGKFSVVRPKTLQRNLAKVKDQ
ncbi:unnamed protein product [Mytilus coruscus]|uniref:MULE transposase domain-containing protein n=1 Tax=Mytilus coruscus TaxID=42192 RepID=A0A6J8ERV8_MYTCO|nr:unnamed protein product [Mytilus coruscus]